MFEDKCVPQKSMCFPDCYNDDIIEKCDNGAENQTCLVLWPEQFDVPAEIPDATGLDDRTPFGHFKDYILSKTDKRIAGFLNVIIFGQRFVWCARKFSRWSCSSSEEPPKSTK